MEDLIQAIASDDLVKTKRIFAEQMQIKKDAAIAARRIQIAESVVVEGEEKAMDDEEGDDDEDDEDDGK